MTDNGESRIVVQPVEPKPRERRAYAAELTSLEGRVAMAVMLLDKVNATKETATLFDAAKDLLRSKK